jgi:hypothetical protein
LRVAHWYLNGFSDRGCVYEEQTRNHYQNKVSLSFHDES